jgi:hypothetical protein
MNSFVFECESLTRDSWLAGVEKATALVITLDFIRDNFSKLGRNLVQEESDENRRDHGAKNQEFVGNRMGKLMKREWY